MSLKTLPATVTKTSLGKFYKPKQHDATKLGGASVPAKESVEGANDTRDDSLISQVLADETEESSEVQETDTNSGNFISRFFDNYKKRNSESIEKIMKNPVTRFMVKHPIATGLITTAVGVVLTCCLPNPAFTPLAFGLLYTFGGIVATGIKASKDTFGKEQQPKTSNETAANETGLKAEESEG